MGNNTTQSFKTKPKVHPHRLDIGNNITSHLHRGLEVGVAQVSWVAARLATSDECDLHFHPFLVLVEDSTPQ
jgi:hypothetical protein